LAAAVVALATTVVALAAAVVALASAVVALAAAARLMLRRYSRGGIGGVCSVGNGQGNQVFA